MTIDRFDDAVCCACARSATGIGFAPKAAYGRPPHPVMWVCDDPDCLLTAKASYAMTTADFSRIESLAAQEGRFAAETYCDEIGKYDFRELTIDEACEFSRRLIAGYREALRVKLRDEAPF